MESTPVIIIGASAAGLATAACLKKKGVEFILLEKEPHVAQAWRNHYDRLHLHTSRSWSALPFKSFHPSIPKYPSRRDVIDYLENYMNVMDLHPRFNTEVNSVKKENGNWKVNTTKGDLHSKYVVFATGLNHSPNLPSIKGLETFPGEILHSSAYRNGAEFAGKDVLVVGFGNSACEQAICLFEHGAHAALSVRSPVNVLPRDIFGVPILQAGKLTSFLSPRVADKINAPLIRLFVPNFTKFGLKRSNLGPREQVEKLKRIPLLDVGTMKLIKDGSIEVFGDILRIYDKTVYFEDGKKHDFDAIILATGYRHRLEKYIELSDDRLNDLQLNVTKQKYFGKDGLYFCGFYVSPRGMLKEISEEAKLIAENITLLSPSSPPAP